MLLQEHFINIFKKNKPNFIQTLQEMTKEKAVCHLIFEAREVMITNLARLL